MDTDNASSALQARIAHSSDGAAAETPRVTPTHHASLDDYEIIREIGRGGTAIVYEAFHKKLRRKVALKQLPAAAALDPRWRDGFDNEVRATSRLSHPNIVPFYELGKGAAHFYTMQLVDGISLAEVIRCLRQCRAGARPCMNGDADAVHPAFLKLCHYCKCRVACNPGEPGSEPIDLTASPEYHYAVVELVRDAALAVQHAHDQGVLHLDIKPSNILIDDDKNVWVTDFGAARTDDAPVSKSLSGTLCYGSPEQLLGHEDQLDARSDVYSLGATLYELLTLEPPFCHESPHALLTQVSLGQFSPPGQTNSAVPAEMNAIIDKAMAREPDQRYATVAELSNDLERYLAAPTKPPQTRESHSTRRLVRIAAAAIAVVVLVATLVAAPWRTSFPTPVHEWNGHYYALTGEELDWESAEAEAVSHGGHLITINSKEEQAFVERTFLTPPDSVYWIGMTDARKEGEWRWISGEPVEYTNWENRGEPNNVIWKDADTGKTMDEDYGVINWHFIVQPPRRRACTWNDINSARNDDRITPHRGIMEFASDPR
jgi:serine/threonine protein kinase